MTLPSRIDEPSALDPLLLLPLPAKLPSSPLPTLEPLLSALEERLNQPGTSADGLAIFTAHMRQVTRRAQTLLNASRVGAAEARETLDRVDVDLRGVEYERDRIREEIAKCEDYEAAYTDIQVDDSFVPDSETLPAPDSDSYDYALIIARLQNELLEIEKREAAIASLTKDRDGIIQSKKDIKRKFDTSDVYLGDFAKTAAAMSSKVMDVAKGN
ncbi:hypothetical protein BD324DRAFT_5727 [Kockovaella imperatae]|uniref:Fms-interacting protein-domain-containing protein n=1 Tax=Kockovaella imperatae TaxID=4999 RepID=A0A1Y1UR43_9TREE|nr:hypothetical protein BD324DRAFT_5727 [Kockovaella imperatae]ORX40523.1 hypothetical protein BD324DRAFT_5727 [Kockovaella imperatae]